MKYEERSISNIKTLQPALQNKFLAWYKKSSAILPAGVEILVYFGYRSFSEQEALYKKWIAYKAYLNYKNGKGPYAPKAPEAGRANKPGESPHNYGYAVDWAFVKNGKLYWSELPEYTKVVTIAKQLGLKSGSDYKGSSIDLPHLENDQEYGSAYSLLKKMYPDGWTPGEIVTTGGGVAGLLIITGIIIAIMALK